jgi:hypothetical protein
LHFAHFPVFYFYAVGYSLCSNPFEGSEFSLAKAENFTLIEQILHTSLDLTTPS